MSSDSAPSRLPKDRTSGNMIVLPPQNSPVAASSVQPVAQKIPKPLPLGLPINGTQEKQELGSQFRTEIDTKIEGAMRQQLNALLRVVLGSEIQSFLDVTQTDWTALLEGRIALVIENVAPKIIYLLLLALQVSIKKKSG